MLATESITIPLDWTCHTKSLIAAHDPTDPHKQSTTHYLSFSGQHGPLNVSAYPWPASVQHMHIWRSIIQCMFDLYSHFKTPVKTAINPYVVTRSLYCTHHSYRHVHIITTANLTIFVGLKLSVCMIWRPPQPILYSLYDNSLYDNDL
jgi:hypothetical protein